MRSVLIQLLCSVFLCVFRTLTVPCSVEKNVGRMTFQTVFFSVDFLFDLYHHLYLNSGVGGLIEFTLYILTRSLVDFFISTVITLYSG